MRAQMSVERFVQCHKFVWQKIIDELLLNNSDFDIIEEKIEAVHELKESGMIDNLEEEILFFNRCCFLCAHFESCYECRLIRCDSVHSLYTRACNGDISAAQQIRDCVDYLLEGKEDTIFIYV